MQTSLSIAEQVKTLKASLNEKDKEIKKLQEENIKLQENNK